MSNDALPPPDPLEEQLVAYLDGELDADARQRIEALLASDSRARMMLHDLERAWEMLEELDAPAPSEHFTQTTLEMVAIAAKAEVEQTLAEVPRRRRRCGLIVATGLLVATACGFLTVMQLTPDPNRQLYEDLPILERLDEYRQIENIDYLRQLRDQGLFTKETAEDVVEKDVSAISPAQRIEGMTLAEKEQLQRAQLRLASLEPKEQEALHQLHASLQEAQDADALRWVMQHYWQWVKTLPAYSRAELANLDSEDRIDWVKKRLEAARAREKEKKIGKKDSEVVLQWVKEHAVQQESALLQGVPEVQRQKLRAMNQAMRQNLILWQLSQWWQTAEVGKAPPMMTDGDLVDLCKKLGPDTRKLLESKPIEEQWPLVILWSRHVIRQQLGNKTMRAPAADDYLADFFEHGLNDEERDRLLNMSGEDMQRELARLFFQGSNAQEKTNPETKPSKKP